MVLEIPAIFLKARCHVPLVSELLIKYRHGMVVIYNEVEEMCVYRRRIFGLFIDNLSKKTASSHLIKLGKYES